MDSIDTLQTLMASRSGRAVPRLSYRHDHLESNPMVISGFHLAGDKGAVMALMWGTDRDSPELVIVPEPRDRDLRFQKLERFADALNAHIAATPFGSAPQVIFPNKATADWLLDLVGRFTRYSQTNDSIREMGRTLSLLASQFRIPGNSIVLTASESLERQFVNGQTTTENANLATQLAWIDPPAGVNGREAALAVEDLYLFGPITEPQWDADVLEPHMVSYNKAKATTAEGVSRAEADLSDRLRDVILPGWRMTWDAITILRTVPEAAHVDARWANDRARWVREAPSVLDGSRRFPIFPSPVGSAILLDTLEDAIQNLAHQMAVDDPMMLARHELAGRAITGTVTNVQLDARQLVGTRMATRPLVTVMSEDTIRPVVGTELFLTSDPSVELRLVAKVDREATLQVVAGALTRATFPRLPGAGEFAGFCTVGAPQFSRRAGRYDVPWTHTLAAAGADAEEVAI
jgi:hypothetical protein